MNQDNQSDLFLQLTERWQDGQYAQVADYIRHDIVFSNRANLIDFCLYLSNIFVFLVINKIYLQKHLQ